jgi:hypothetical protein
MTWRDLKKGDRIRLVRMGDDPDPIPAGTEGTVTFVSALRFSGPNCHQIGVDWDNGRTLSLTEADSWRKIDG